MFRAHPESAARLLSRIPRLEVVAEIIGGQHRPEEGPCSTAESKQSRFDGPMLDTLTQAEFNVRRLPIRELRSRMILDSDVLSTDSNLLIFKKGTTLTETWIERQVNFAKAPGLKEPVEVRVPRSAGVRRFEELVYGAN